MNEDDYKYLDPSNIRKIIVRLTGISAILCLIVEICVYLYYKSINYYPDERIYVIFRVILPSTINLLLLSVSIFAYNFKNLLSSVKNFIVSTNFILLMCSISINHAFYMVLWISPLLAVYVCIPFKNLKLFRHLIALSILNIFVSAAYLSWEYPENFSIYAQNVIVAIIIDSILIIAGTTMERYFLSFVSVSQSHLKKELEYEKRLHYDYLTGLYSKEQISRIAEKCLINCNAENPVCFAIFDLDDFKKINDTYGHNNGDIVLKKIGQLFKSYSDNKVHTGRFGGEEFILCSECVEEKEILELVEKIRTEISEQSFDFMSEKLTISGGCYFTKVYLPYEDVFNAADKQLYKSKANGKNQITYNN